MTTETKTIILQDLQCRHKTWLASFNSALGFGKCVDKNHLHNITITNLIDVVYRYEPWDDVVTNAFSIDFTLVGAPPCGKADTLTLTITIGALVYTTSTPCLEDVILALQTIIETDGIYNTIYEDGVLTMYTTDPGETFTLPTVEYLFNAEALLGIVITALDNTFVPDIQCLEEVEVCDIICKIRNLTTNCSC